MARETTEPVINSPPHNKALILELSGPLTATERALRALLRKVNIDCIYLAETKVDIESMNIVYRRLGIYGKQQWVRQVVLPLLEIRGAIRPATVGRAGGFYLFWRLGVQLDLVHTDESIIEVCFHEEVGSPRWTLVCVHGPLYTGGKRREKVRGISVTINEARVLRLFMDDTGGGKPGLRRVHEECPESVEQGILWEMQGEAKDPKASTPVYPKQPAISDSSRGKGLYTTRNPRDLGKN
ncbi:hypothetical protein TorRG33x02_138790 [Trema orientale]|uniref:Uncharacterized protein n=1 Tax=Trema orientale TaxID=63057 RepID=A0A2P5EXG7_TREOI|nr:hypothetical protein TorRG33x02_138790 [Trema orientale]